MIIYYNKNFALEWHKNLKHWGSNIHYGVSDGEVTKPYIRIFALFIWYKGLPTLID